MLNFRVKVKSVLRVFFLYCLVRFHFNVGYVEGIKWLTVILDWISSVSPTSDGIPLSARWPSPEEYRTLSLLVNRKSASLRALKEEDVIGAAEDPVDELFSDEGASCGRARALGVHPCAALVHVARAATLAKETCKNVQSQSRWNCSSIDQAPDFTPELLVGTKEQSFVYALSSAALTYTMARACSSGALFSCTCAQPPRERPNGNFKWGGCSDNLKWASRFVRQFVETQRKVKNNYRTTISASDEKKDAQVQTTTESLTISKFENETRSKYAISHEIATLVKRDIANGENGQKKTKTLNKALLEKKLQKLQPYIDVANVQNSKFGRKMMERWMSIQCKCHGVSGSCSVRTCWRALKPIEGAAARLKSAASRALRLPRTPPPTPPPSRLSFHQNLLYVATSPNYCSRNPSTGSLGTRARWCNGTTRAGDGSCRNLCCGRGYRTSTSETLERCNCRYIWCCKVECDICKTITETHYCN